MPNIPCPNSTPCFDPANPITNYSSESPDQEVFLGFGSTVIQPTAGHPFDNGGGYFYCSSTVSQDAADLCAYNGGVDNGPDSGGTSNNPPPNTGNDSGNWGSQIFWNDAQTASVTCPDGGTFTYTLPAMSVRATSVIYANRIALSIATIRANRFLICISNVSSACLGEAYDQTITASTEIPGDITWQLRSGVVPPGLHFDFSDPDTSVIGLVGTPTLSGNFTFVLRATDSLGNFTDKTVVMAVLGLTNSPTQATVGAPYSFQFSAAGGTAPYFFSVPVGHLPTGLSMSDSGLISGTPTDPSAFTFTVTLEDNAGHTCFFPFTMTPTGTTCAALLAALSWNIVQSGANAGAGVTMTDGGHGTFDLIKTGAFGIDFFCTSTFTNLTSNPITLHFKLTIAQANPSNAFGVFVFQNPFASIIDQPGTFVGIAQGDSTVINPGDSVDFEMDFETFNFCNGTILITCL